MGALQSPKGKGEAGGGDLGGEGERGEESGVYVPHPQGLWLSGEGAARVNLPSAEAPGGRGGSRVLRGTFCIRRSSPALLYVPYAVFACSLWMRPPDSMVSGGTHPRRESFLWLQFKHDQCR